VDAKTGLMWATADNGYGVGWTRASNYCRDLAVGGYKDWTLPSIDDLQQLFGGPANASGRHVAGPIQITMGVECIARPRTGRAVGFRLWRRGQGVSGDGRFRSEPSAVRTPPRPIASRRDVEAA